MALSLGLCVTSMANAQEVRMLLGKAKSETPYLAATSGDALYDMPAVLANIGTHTSENIPVCNYLTRHKSINGGAFLWAPYETDVRYFDKSTGNPTTWNWTVPGAMVQSFDTQDIAVRYATEGIYDMPTLTVVTDNGTSAYTPKMTMTSAGGNEKVKVGGTVELTTADMRVSAQTYDPVSGACYPSNATYALGAMGYDANGGYVGGSNDRGVVGWGNLFMVGHDEVELTGVNVYFYRKPTKYKQGAKVTLNVWYPLITETAYYFTQNPNTGGYPLESAYIYYSDIKADGENGAWALTYDGAVANIQFENPIDLYGKPYFFISIDGFSLDPANDDLCLLSDMKGVKHDEVQQANALAHNSFGRLNGENEYLRPISSYGGGNGSLMICPVVRSYHTPSAVESVSVAVNKLKAYVSGNNLVVESKEDDVVTLYDMTGKAVKQEAVKSGLNTIDASEVASGLYVVKGNSGNAVKVVKK